MGSPRAPVCSEPSAEKGQAVTVGVGGGAGPWPWGNTAGGPPFYNNVILGCKYDLTISSRGFGADLPSPYGWTSPMMSGGNATDIVNPATPATVAPWKLYPSQNIYPY